jgi:hypothetical protein
MYKIVLKIILSDVCILTKIFLKTENSGRAQKLYSQ